MSRPTAKQELASVERAAKAYRILVRGVEGLGWPDAVGAIANVLEARGKDKKSRTAVLEAILQGQVFLEHCGNGAFLGTPIAPMERDLAELWSRRYGYRPATHLETKLFVEQGDYDEVFSLQLNGSRDSYCSYKKEGTGQVRTHFGRGPKGGLALSCNPAPLNAGDKFLIFKGTESNILYHFHNRGMGFSSLHHDGSFHQVEFCLLEGILSAMGLRVGTLSEYKEASEGQLDRATIVLDDEERWFIHILHPNQPHNPDDRIRVGDKPVQIGQSPRIYTKKKD